MLASRNRRDRRIAASDFGPFQICADQVSLPGGDCATRAGFPPYALLNPKGCQVMKVILLKGHEGSGKTSLWAAAIAQFFAQSGAQCAHIEHGISDNAEVRRLVDSVMIPLGVLIVETDGGEMPIKALVPDFTITVERNADWLDDIGHAALRARLETRLANIDQIDNEHIVTDCLAHDMHVWNAEQQQRLDTALVTLGWSCRHTGENRLEWSRNTIAQESESA